jgi:hypothetical protein
MDIVGEISIEKGNTRKVICVFAVLKSMLLSHRILLRKNYVNMNNFGCLVTGFLWYTRTDVLRKNFSELRLFIAIYKISCLDIQKVGRLLHPMWNSNLCRFCAFIYFLLKVLQI